MSFTQGEMVGPYRIIEKLGRGGMATVFKAYHANLDRYVAIKVLHPAFLEQDSFLARFEREAKVVAKLEHPNITPVYDFAEHNGNPYLVMKYVEGETLKARLKKAPLSPEEGVEIIQTVGDALAYAHRQDILHRDVKPSNVILADDGQIYLTDFGLARIASAGETTISNDMMIGTPQYISPEQAMGKRDMDAGTDIYSFGVLIYELVVGRVPFSADTPFSIIHDHIYTPLPLPRAVNPQVPEVIERLLLKALAKERGDRFQNVDQMVAAFRKAIEGDDLPEIWADPDTYAPTPTPPPVQASAVDPNASTIGAPEVEPDVETAGANGQKRRWRWWYSIPLGMVLCACLLVVIGILNEEPGALPLPPGNNHAENFLDETINETIAELEEDFDNPFAHLELAGLYLEIGSFELAEEHFRIGADLAGDDWSYHLSAGDLLFEHQLWLPALEQYIQVIQIEEVRTDRNFINRFQNTLYHASINPDSQHILFGYTDREVPREIGAAVLFAARARFELHVQQKPELAQETIDSAYERFSESPILQLAQAEIFIETEQYPEAGQILDELKTGGLPWIRDHARALLNKIP
ncbi:MAG: protein kinase [Chloroflexota bacterium]